MTSSVFIILQLAVFHTIHVAHGPCGGDAKGFPQITMFQSQNLPPILGPDGGYSDILMG